MYTQFVIKPSTKNIAQNVHFHNINNNIDPKHHRGNIVLMLLIKQENRGEKKGK